MKGLVVALLLLAGVSVAYGEGGTKQEPKTLLALSGFKLAATPLSNSVLVIIDAQREYLDGKLPLQGMDASVKEAALLLERARKAGTPVIHVVHTGKPGSALFDPKGQSVEIIDALAPKSGETVIKKGLPNAFAGTTLEETLGKLGRKNLVVVGYMTHMCVSSTVRAATDKGYRSTVVAKATATRTIPAPGGGIVTAENVQYSSLAALADRFAAVVQTSQEIPD
jgi:nicotinamidase-related amidase